MLRRKTNCSPHNNNNSYSSRTCKFPQVTSQDPLLFPFNKTAILYNVSPAEGTRRTGLSRDSRQKDRRNTTPPMYDLGRGLLRQKSPGKKEPWMPLIVTLFPSLPLFPPAAKQHSADKRFYFGVGSGGSVKTRRKSQERTQKVAILPLFQ